MNTKNRSTPVVEKKEEQEETCGCGCKDCSCDSECQCACCHRRGGSVRTGLLCGSILVSALLIAGSILLSPCLCNTPKHHKPLPEKAMKHPHQQLQPSVLPEQAMRNFEIKNEKALRDFAIKNEQTMRDFVLNNPELLIESVEKYYKAKEAKAEAMAKENAKKAEPREFKLENLPKADAALVQQIINDKTNYSLGNKNGKFVIIEFFDYNCGWCKRTNKGLEEAIAKAEGKNIRWIPIDTPIFGEGSETIARYVLAAGEQGKYAEMHAAVGAAKGHLDEEALVELAKDLKLNIKKLKADANGDKIRGKLESNNEFRQKLNIRGVPMVIIDGHINGGALIGDTLDAVVKLSSKK